MNNKFVYYFSTGSQWVFKCPNVAAAKILHDLEIDLVVITDEYVFRLPTSKLIPTLVKLKEAGFKTKEIE